MAPCQASQKCCPDSAKGFPTVTASTFVIAASERGEEELVVDVEPTAATAAVGEMVLAGVHGARRQNAHHPSNQRSPPSRFSPPRGQAYSPTHSLTKEHRHNTNNHRRQNSPYDSYHRGSGRSEGRPNSSGSWGPHRRPGPPYSNSPVRLHRRYDVERY